MRTPFVVVEASLGTLDEGQIAPLQNDQQHHLRRVLRRADGDLLEVSDGAGHVADATLEASGARLASSPRWVTPQAPVIEVVHALPKGRAMDEVVRTLTELGVARIHPVLTARTESRPTGAKAAAVGARLRSVAVQAAQQARSAHVCRISDVRPLAVTEGDGGGHPLRLIAHPVAARGLGAALRDGRVTDGVIMLIGPEGGLTDQEVERFVAAGWEPVRAGSTVLRTVNAGVVLTAAVLALAGRFDDGHVG